MKLFIEEPGSEWARECWDEFPERFTSRMSYAEVRAALASIVRSGRMDEDELASVKALFEEYWSRIEVIEPSPELVEAAGDMAELLALRGSDAIQLVSSMYARSAKNGVYMLTWDNDLARASYDAGINVIRTTYA